jgi:hypothetical protein
MEEEAGPNDQALRNQVQARASQVQGLLQTSKKSAALRAAIENPPVATKDARIKVHVLWNSH